MSDKQDAQPLIELKSISKVFSMYGTEAQGLSNVHFTVFPGEYVAIQGPSGSGKSTLLSILGLLDSPTSGIYEFEGHDTSQLSYSDLAELRNRDIGFVFQSCNLIEQMTVYENVALPLSYRRGMKSTELRERVFDSLVRVGLEHLSKRYPAQLSGGEQQRVSISRAIAGSPSLLLADEPTGNLDSRSGETVMQLLSELHQDGSTICTVTHDPKFALFAQRQVGIFDGKTI